MTSLFISTFEILNINIFCMMDVMSVVNCSVVRE